MKAIVIHQFGGPEVLTFQDWPDPVPGPGEVLIRVHAVSVNRVLDIEVRKGTQTDRGIELPLIPGIDPSGEIVAVGDGVTTRAVGDRVAVLYRLDNAGISDDTRPGSRVGPTMIGIHRQGGDAELIAVPEAATLPIPNQVTYPQATVICRHAPTAYKQVHRVANVQPGERVLVMGASGNLGSLVVQFARNAGAEVIAAAGSDARVAVGLELGASHGINYRHEDLTEVVMGLTDGEGVDVVFDNIADPVTCPMAIRSLARGGRLVTSGAHGGPNVIVDFARLYDRELTLMGRGGSTNREDFQPCLEAAAEGKLGVHVAKVMKLSEAAEAHRTVEKDYGSGKIILDPTLDSQ